MFVKRETGWKFDVSGFINLVTIIGAMFAFYYSAMGEIKTQLAVHEVKINNMVTSIKENTEEMKIIDSNLDKHRIGHE